MPREYSYQPPPALEYDATVTGVGSLRGVDLYSYQMFDIIYGGGLLTSVTPVCTGDLREKIGDSFGIVASSGGAGPTYTVDVKYQNCDPDLTDPFSCEWLAPTYCINSGDLTQVRPGDYFLVANKQNSGDSPPYNIYRYEITGVRNLNSGVISGVLISYTLTLDIEYVTDSSGLGTADPINFYTSTAAGTDPGNPYAVQYVTPMSITRGINNIVVFEA